MPSRQDSQHHLDAVTTGQILTSEKSVGELAALIEQQRTHLAELVAFGRDTQRAEMLLAEMQRTLAETVTNASPRQPKQRD